jgi:hypothetical protein
MFTTRACLMPYAVGYDNAVSSVVDIFNMTTGCWSTAALSQARSHLAASSLPNAGVVFFAGGASTFCDFCVKCCRMHMGVRGMRDRIECGCAYDASLSHALCSDESSRLPQCCGHLQRGDWNLEHCSSQPGPGSTCSRVAAECRNRDLRWWFLYVL